MDQVATIGQDVSELKGKVAALSSRQDILQGQMNLMGATTSKFDLFLQNEWPTAKSK